MRDNGRIFVASAGLLPGCLFVLPLCRMSAISDAAQSALTGRRGGEGPFGGNCHESLQAHVQDAKLEALCEIKFKIKRPDMSKLEYLDRRVNLLDLQLCTTLSSIWGSNTFSVSFVFICAR